MYLLSQKEKRFLLYWEQERNKKNKNAYFLLKGIRNASIFITAIILSLTTGWYKRITLLTPGLMITFLVSCFLLAIFISVFTAYHQTEENEQRYWELKRLIEKK